MFVKRGRFLILWILFWIAFGVLIPKAHIYACPPPPTISNPQLLTSSQALGLAQNQAQLARSTCALPLAQNPVAQASFIDGVDTYEQDALIYFSQSPAPSSTAMVQYLTNLNNQLVSLQNRTLSSVFGVQYILQSITQGISPSVTSPSNLQVPDPGANPSTELAWAQILKLTGGAPAPGSTSNEKIRAVVANNFERMARTFVAGSDQLVRDGFFPMQNPVTKAPVKIRGLYQGYKPDLLNELSGTYLEGAYDPDWGRCTSGVINTDNSKSQWFRGTNGYTEKLTGQTLQNHRCSPTTLRGRHEFPLNRGKAVEHMMQVMKAMRDQIKNTGRIPAPSNFGSVPDVCQSYWAQAQGFRTGLRSIRAETLAEIQGATTLPQRAAECFEMGSPSTLASRQIAGTASGSLAPARTLFQNQIRVCHLLHLQMLVEVELPTRYAYCVWKTVADTLIEEMTRALIP